MNVYKPLKGVKVVELSTMVAATSCGRMLADWGAEVIKIETAAGDNFRNFPRTFFVPCTMDENPMFDELNAGKRGIVLNLKTAEGMDAIHKMLADADIFLTNTRPEPLKKLGLDYDSLKEKYPGLIVATITGFGDKGPRANDPGYDTVAFWASTGFNADMMVETENSYPVYGSAGPGDIITAMGLCYAITAALYKKKETGLGDHVSTSLYGTALFCFSIMEICQEEQYGPKFTFPKKRSESAPTGSAFKCKDGEWVMTTMVGVQIEQKWGALCRALGCDDLADDPRYNNQIGQRNPEYRPYLISRFEEAYAKLDSDEICARLKAADIVHDKLGHYKDMEKSEQAWANEYVHKVTCPNGKTSILARPAMRSAKMGIPAWKRGPMLGEHTDEVLAELGYTGEQIEAMKANGAATQIDMSQYIK